MGESANRAIMLGVGILITVIIASSIFSLFSQAKNVFSEVGKTNTDIMKGFGEYPMYNNTQLTGLDLINCANKYYEDNLVLVVFDGTQLNTATGVEYVDNLYENGNIKYEDMFFSTVEDIEVDGVEKKQITFTKM